MKAAGVSAATGMAVTAQKPPLPPAIAALKNRRSEAHPITDAERAQRMERAKELMRANKIDAICLAGGANLLYFTGVRWGNSERLFMAVLPQKGRIFWVAPAFEEDRARELMTDKDARIYTWQEDDNPYALVGRGLKDTGLATGKLGVDERTVFVFSDGLRQTNNTLETASATAITAGCRARKSPAELALLTLANNVTLDAYEAAWKSVHEGMTNRELSGMIVSGFEQQGFTGNVSVQTNEFAANPHGSIKPQQIKEGSVVMMDDGVSVEGYVADVTRTVAFGKPPDKVKQVFDIVLRAQSAALAAAKPGAACETVDAAARKVIEDGGYGPGYKYFTHRLGHGIGMEGHEWPYLVKGNKQLMESAMTFSDEPGIYIAGEFGVRLEDCMHVTASGAETFTPRCKSLETPFAR
jgi:Xaa-Pro dipeptidase